MEYDIVFKEHLSKEDFDVIDNGLQQEAELIFGKVPRGSLAFFAHDKNGDLVGGVIGFWDGFGWLYVNSIWVAEQSRGTGLGSLLMSKIESEAKQRSCHNCYLNTMTFQAPGFYKKLGYQIFGELNDFPPGHSRLFLSKQL
jgi:ribosomal protein S18 acetylase RimI-like enzyme